MNEFVRPKKSLGQNFLTDPGYTRWICDAAQLGTQDQVLEIGPGLGHLTRELAGRAGRLLVIELDDRLIPRLRGEFADRPDVAIVHADALSYDYGSLPGTWKVVANLPYYISTPILQRLIAARGRFVSLALMLQQEVAERIAASPGGKEYGYLSVLVQYSAVPAVAFRVPAAAFTPRPKVDSAVVTLSIRPRPDPAADDEALFIRVVKAAFSQRRKTLRNSLGQLGYPREVMNGVQAALNLDLGRRAETLSVAEFVALANHLAAR